MNSEQILAWACRGLSRPARDGLAARVRCLAKPLEEARLELDFFEAAVDTEKGLRRAKVVHVARAVEDRPLTPRQVAELSRLRERTLLSLFAMTPGLDPRPLKALYAGLKRHGVAGGFVPIASVECDAQSGAFTEISLYTDERAKILAGPMAAATGAPPPSTASLLAVGYDFRPGLPARLKLYRKRRWAALDPGRLEVSVLAALPASERPAYTLSLARLPEGGAWEKPRKVYLAYNEWRSPEDARTVAMLKDACAPGPLRDFLVSLVEAGAGAHVMDYLGCEEGRIEAYFGLPFWRATAAAVPQRQRSWEESW